MINTRQPESFSMNLTFIAVLLMPALLLVDNSPVYANEAVVETGVNPGTKLKYWLYDNNGFYLKLTQRLPDQTRAYFEARGFDQAAAETAATSCVFQTMIKNSGKGAGMSVNAELSDWIVVSRGNNKPMLLREYWQRLWLQRNQTQSARVAFEWSLLPSSIQYDVSDYNWGMSSYGLPPGSHFDLLFNWTRKGIKYNGKISDVVCPDDIHPEPTS